MFERKQEKPDANLGGINVASIGEEGFGTRGQQRVCDQRMDIDSITQSLIFPLCAL